MKNKILLRCTLKYIWIYIIAYIFLFASQYIVSLISVFIGEVLAIFAGENHILPAYLSQFIDETSTYTKIMSLCTIFVITSIILVVLRLCQQVLRTYSARKIEITVSQEFFYHVLKLPKNYLVTHPTGDIIQRNIQDSAKFVNMLNHGLWGFGYSIFSIILSASSPGSITIHVLFFSTI